MHGQSHIRFTSNVVHIDTKVRLRDPYALSYAAQFNCVKKNWTECSLAYQRFPIRSVSSVSLLVQVTVVDKNKTVACSLLATSAIMLSEKKKRKRKMWSKKWYLKRNICDAYLLNGFWMVECLEMSSWCWQVNWGNYGIPWTNCAVLRVKDDWKGHFWGLRYCPSKLSS